MNNLERRGVRCEFDPASLAPRGYLGAPDEIRARHMNVLLARSDLSALMAVRGGYGTLRILDALDYDSACSRPKLLVGYSDVTALQCAFYMRCGWTSVQGPMAAVEWPDIDPDTEAHFWKLVSGHMFEALCGPGDEKLSPLRPGEVEGPLLGGNLSVIARLIGTPFLPPLDGAILFLEDVGEQPYRIDALFAQLKLSGILDRLGGLVLGAFTDCGPRPDRPSLAIREVIHDYFGSAPYPVADGLVYGHVRRKASMPFGIRARLAVTETNAVLSMLEPVVDTSA
jgi:muramoyltetrapeptide carboxypeptidase